MFFRKLTKESGIRIIKIMKIQYEQNRFGHYTLFNDQDDRSIYIQEDSSFPALAESFGFKFDYNDRNYLKVINEAQKFLDENEGKEVEDIGYFE